jgi:hypothetical protein
LQDVGNTNARVTCRREGERDCTRASNQEGEETGRKRGHEETRYTCALNLGGEEAATISAR